jgi:hypothetical protein
MYLVAVASYGKITYRDKILYGQRIYCLMRLLADHRSTAVRLPFSNLKPRFSAIYLICVIFTHTAVKRAMLALNVR